MTTAPARYIDGHTAASHEVVVTLEPGQIAITDGTGHRFAFWPLGSLHSIDRWPLRGGPLRLGSSEAPTARLMIDDVAFRRTLLTSAPHAGYPAHQPLPRSLRRVSIMAAAISAVVAVIFVAAPWYAGPAANLIPFSWEQQFGASIVADFKQVQGLQTCAEATGDAALQDLTERLAGAANFDYLPSVEVIDDGTSNAFAFPGGNIMVLRGLIDQADSADEVAGVLAHELGHAVHRDGLKGLVRANARVVVLDAMTGGTLSAYGYLADAGTALLELPSSREAETAADGFAVETLRRAGIRTAGLKRFFSRVAKTEVTGGVLNYLSTHPVSADRVAAIPDIDGDRGLSENQWAALQGICASTQGTEG